MNMDLACKTRKQIAQEARQRHERLYRKVCTMAGKPGITRLRIRLQDALLERMRAELDAGMV